MMVLDEKRSCHPDGNQYISRQLVALEGKVIRIDPMMIVNVCTKLHGNPFNVCGYISLWATVVDQQMRQPTNQKAVLCKHTLYLDCVLMKQSPTHGKSHHEDQKAFVSIS